MRAVGRLAVAAERSIRHQRILPDAKVRVDTPVLPASRRVHLLEAKAVGLNCVGIQPEGEWYRTVTHIGRCRLTIQSPHGIATHDEARSAHRGVDAHLLHVAVEHSGRHERPSERIASNGWE